MEDIYKNFEIKEYLLNYEPNSWKKIVEQLALLGIKYLKSKPPKTNGYTLQELINLNNIEQTKKVTVEAKKNFNIKQTKNKSGYGSKTISTIKGLASVRGLLRGRIFLWKTNQKIIITEIK